MNYFKKKYLIEKKKKDQIQVRNAPNRISLSTLLKNLILIRQTKNNEIHCFCSVALK